LQPLSVARQIVTTIMRRIINPIATRLGRGAQPPKSRAEALRVVFFGTYDLEKPRNRLMLEALRRAGFEVQEVHFDAWKGVADKAMLTRMAGLRRVLRWICAYPFLIARYLSAPSHDIVIVGYLGHLDVLILRPFAWLRRVPIMWDVFISLYDTVVCDRGMLKHNGIVASTIWGWEWLACRCADRLLIDTTPHAEYLCDTYGLARSRVCGHSS